MTDHPQADCALKDKRQNSWFERAIRKRFGIFMLVSLVSWPLLGFWSVAEAIVANALFLDTYWQLGFLTMVNVVAFYFCFAILRLQNQRLGGRFWSRVAGKGNLTWNEALHLRNTILSLIAPAVLAACFGSEFPTTAAMHAIWSLLSIAIGVLFAFVLLWALGSAKSMLFGSNANTANYFSFEGRSRGGFEFLKGLATWIDNFAKRFGLLSIDVQFVIYLTLLASVQYGAAHLFEADEFWLTSAPSMLVVLIWLSLMYLSGLANLLDPHRVPVTLVLLLIAVLQLFRGATRPLTSVVDKSANGFVAAVATVRDAETAFVESGQPSGLRPSFIADQTSALEDSAWMAIEKRMQKVKPPGDKKKTLVVVTCPGGGIHAAAWAACVLDQLSDEYVEFRDSLAVISGVSGGSVGALLFVGSRFDDKLSGATVAAAPLRRNKPMQPLKR